jgi:DNA (cytosine-5)-methyltransferase 3A
MCKNNYPNTKHIGSVTEVKGINLPNIHLLIGGSPCQSFSTMGLYREEMGDKVGFEGKSGLFWEYVRVLKEIKPRYFLLENVVMKKEWEDLISEALGVKPIKINSALLSHQRRNRLYWTNIPNVKQPIDLGLDFRSIIETSVDEKYYLTERAVERVREKQGFDLVTNKSKCLFATYYKNNSNTVAQIGGAGTAGGILYVFSRAETLAITVNVGNLAVQGRSGTVNVTI